MKNLILLALLLNSVQAKDFIEIYASYANPTELIVSGRVVDSEDKKSSEERSKEHSLWQNLKENLGKFSHDEKKNIDLTLEVNTFSTTIKTDDEGYFLFNLHTPLTTKQTVLLYTKNKKEAKEVKLFVPNSQKHIGIISDFDDTVIVSDVTNKLKLLSNTLFKNFKQREVVKEVKEEFDKILKTDNIENRAVFFVTGSPHQLQENINAFLDLHKFPKRVLLSKKIQGENSDDLLSTIAYKYDKIVRLIKMYPQVTWVCFGDSGEKDRDVYLKVLKNYPKKIKAIYIRNVDSKKIEEVYLNQTAVQN